jgi:hypothetical protein
MAARLGHKEPLYLGFGLVYRGCVSFCKCLGLLLLVAGCGGGTPGPAAPADEKPSDSEAQAGEAKARPAPRATRVTCDDGSCFSCGEATCLTGFYCTVNRRAHGCAWMPGCATKVTCACLATALRETPGCTCEEKNGGVYVNCDGATL